jgi:hypothetical protein
VLVKTQSATTEDAIGESRLLKRGRPPWMAAMHSHSFLCIAPFHLPSPRIGSVRVAFVLLSLKERNFAEVGTFQPSLSFKDFHQAARLHPQTDGHPRR